MFRYISAAFSAAILVMPLYGGNYEVKSPDGRLKAEVSVGERIGYTVSCGDDIILRSSEIGMILRDRSLGQDAVLKSTERESVDRTEECLFPISDANIRNCYNSLTLNMKGGYSVEFRAFNDGIAYRFITDLKGDIEVLDERFSLEFPGNTDAVLSLNRGFKTSYEQPYTVIPVGDIRQDGQVSYLPVLFRTESAGSGNVYSILMSEADLYDYPCMFLRSDGKGGLDAVFPKCPLEFGEDGDRSDQWMVNYYERVASEAARHHLMVDFHGSFKPAGLEKKYPNILSYEGVRGMEQMGGCTPDNSLYLPFIRNAVGPMDYTPGAMISMQPEVYRSKRPNSASIGTRAYQMALYTVFKSGIQMLADSPTCYYRNPECTGFIASVPVVWDESRVLDAKAGEYIIVARRSGEKWFIGAICNGREDSREFTVSLDFLDSGRSYAMTSFSDGPNSGRQAMDYRMKKTQVDSGSVLDIRMARNGGWTAVLE